MGDTTNINRGACDGFGDIFGTPPDVEPALFMM